VNKVVKTKASAEATPPGTADPQEPDKDVTSATPPKIDVTEPKSDGDLLEEIQNRPHPFK
jgi:hypothetical protein